MKSFDDLSDRQLELISHALYMTYSSMTLPRNKIKGMDSDEAELQHRINREIKLRKEKEVYHI